MSPFPVIVMKYLYSAPSCGILFDDDAMLNVIKVVTETVVLNNYVYNRCLFTIVTNCLHATYTCVDREGLREKVLP